MKSDYDDLEEHLNSENQMLKEKVKRLEAQAKKDTWQYIADCLYCGNLDKMIIDMVKSAVNADLRNDRKLYAKLIKSIDEAKKELK